MLLERFIEETIFFREFKSQLHEYLNIHRYIWEEIAAIKEKGEIGGSEVGMLKQKIESYQKTINLISTRIDQMSTYVGTRESILKNDKSLSKILSIMEYKHETLKDTLSYLRDIWSMTQNYVNSALQLFSEIQAKTTNNSVTNLIIVTSVGVGATLLGLFTKTQLPAFTLTGVGYFIILLIIGVSANKITRKVAEKRVYKINDIKINTKIG